MRATILIAALTLAACGASSPDFCDIRSSACRERTFRAVLEDRGDAWDAWSASPPSEVITADQLRQRLEASLPTTPAAPTLWDKAYVVLDMLTPTTDPAQASIDDFVNSVAAFYSPTSGRVTIIDTGAPQSDAQLKTNSIILAHELTHFVQDRDKGLDRFESDVDTSDKFFARRALIEGEAVLQQEIFSFRVQGRDYHKYDWNGWYDQMRAGFTSDLATASNRLESGMSWFLYPVGGRLTTAAYIVGGNLAVRDLWANPAPDSLAMLEPYRTAAPPAEAFDCPAPFSPPATTQGGADRLGAMGLYVLGADRWLAADDVWALVPAWRNDTLWAYTTTTGTVAMWRARFAAGTDLGALLAGIQAATSTHEVRAEVVGQELTVAATDQTGLLDSWTGWRCNH